MFCLKRIVDPYEYRKCYISQQFIQYGDYYYEDEKGRAIKADVYIRLRRAKIAENFDYTNLQNAECQQEYREELREKEADFIAANALDIPIQYKEEGVNKW